MPHATGGRQQPRNSQHTKEAHQRIEIPVERRRPHRVMLVRNNDEKRVRGAGAPNRPSRRSRPRAARRAAALCGEPLRQFCVSKAILPLTLARIDKFAYQSPVLATGSRSSVSASNIHYATLNAALCVFMAHLQASPLKSSRCYVAAVSPTHQSAY